MSSRTSVEDLTVHCHWNFESVSDMLDYLEIHPRLGGTLSSTSTGNQAWYGTASYSMAVQALKNGWPEGLNDIDTLRERLMGLGLNEILGEAEVESYDVAGSYVDVGAYLEGDPECMIDWGVEEAPNARVISVYINSGALQDVSGQMIMQRGAATMALIDALEGYGIRCEVVMIAAVTWKPRAAKPSGGPCGSYARVVVKRAHEPLDVDRLAFIIANPSWHRRFMFHLRETEPDCPQGYGASQSLTLNEVQGNALVIPTAGTSEANRLWSSDESATKWIIDQLAYVVPSLHEDLVRRGERAPDARQIANHGR